MSFKSAVLLSRNKIVIDRLRFPKLRYGQALVKILYSSICHTQVQEIIGQRGKDHYLPHCLGHEAVGLIKDKHNEISYIKNYGAGNWLSRRLRGHLEKQLHAFI